MRRNLQALSMMLMVVGVVLGLLLLLLVLGNSRVVLPSGGSLLEQLLLEALWRLRVRPLQPGALRSRGRPGRQVGGVACRMRMLGTSWGALVHHPDGDGLCSSLVVARVVAPLLVFVLRVRRAVLAVRILPPGLVVVEPGAGDVAEVMRRVAEAAEGVREAGRALEKERSIEN